VSANIAIEWTESTWNPLTGCSEISPGRRHGRSSTSQRSRTSGRRCSGNAVSANIAIEWTESTWNPLTGAIDY